MLTDKQQKIFSKVLDLNYDFDREMDFAKRSKMIIELSNAKDELRESMGSKAYNEFMSMGEKLFS